MSRTRIPGIGVIAVLILVLFAAPALAAKGGNGGKSAIWIEESATARSADGNMHYAEQVTFGHETRYTDDRGRGPWIELRCEQDGNVVYREWRAGFEGGYRYGEAHNLGPSAAWSGGEADCTGILGHYNKNFGKFLVDATVDFHVMG
jgi:hypothetical protein